MRWTRAPDTCLAVVLRVGRGSHGSAACGGADRVGWIGAAAARFECPAAIIQLHALDDSLCPDPDYTSSRDPDGDDAPGSPDGGLPLPAPGAGHADRALEP